MSFETRGCRGIIISKGMVSFSSETGNACPFSSEISSRSFRRSRRRDHALDSKEDSLLLDALRFLLFWEGATGGEAGLDLLTRVFFPSHYPRVMTISFKMMSVRGLLLVRSFGAFSTLVIFFTNSISAHSPKTECRLSSQGVAFSVIKN